MSNVINLMPTQATADEVLEDCKGDFNHVLVIGWTEDDALIAKATESMDLKETVYLMEVFKQAIIMAGHDVE
tara:strand:- start:359 stop:574 length:216 start_codon:yes stop_codon:yes gene_type:complete